MYTLLLVVYIEVLRISALPERKWCENLHLLCYTNLPSHEQTFACHSATTNLLLHLSNLFDADLYSGYFCLSAPDLSFTDIEEESQYLSILNLAASVCSPWCWVENYDDCCETITSESLRGMYRYTSPAFWRCKTSNWNPIRAAPVPANCFLVQCKRLQHWERRNDECLRRGGAVLRPDTWFPTQGLQTWTMRI